MSTWRNLLTEASHWGEYRRALDVLQQDEGPSFKDMAARSGKIASGVPDATSYSGGTLHKLTVSELRKEPKWEQVEVFVRACVEHGVERGERWDGEEVVRLWKDGFRRLKGDEPPPPPERRRGMLAAVGAVVVLAVGAVAFSWPFSDGSGGDGKPDTEASSAVVGGTPSPSVATPTTPAATPSTKQPPVVDPVDGQYLSGIAWSDSGGPTVVWVYADYTNTDRGRESATGHGYNTGQDIIVLCQVSGRSVPLGTYRGPNPERNGLWYRMSTGEYIPAIYVDTGRDSLPAC
ncbi:hypothetical protein ABT224_36950 [Streptomyces sp. NPDC001584]|uniref:hypothetical protein n=1 Tax=Streptomyces sp. NPDC001584 TaxID=3154521 RepID=UPI00331E9DC9